jgi:hypothetical protein
MDDASVGPTVVPLDFLREITNGFAEEHELGSGSFGKVYLVRLMMYSYMSSSHQRYHTNIHLSSYFTKR